MTPGGCHVHTVQDAVDFLSWLGERRPVLAVDTETGGTTGPHRDALRLVVFADAAASWSLSYRQWRGVIETALATYDRQVAFLNAPFDMWFLSANGLATPRLHLTHDAGIMDRLVCPGLSHRLKDIGQRLYPGAKAEQDALAPLLCKDSCPTPCKNHPWTWATIPDNHPVYTAYARKDGTLTAKITEHHAESVAAQGLTRAYEREMAAQEVMYRAQVRGMRIDRPYTVALRDRMDAEMLALREKVPEFDITQATALEGVLIRDGWEPQEWTPTGQVKFTAAIREALDDPFARLHTRYKRLEKWSAAYVQAFLDEQDDNGRVHAKINSFQAITGRMSISNPALQQLPRGAEIRNCVLPYEGETLWNVDYRAMEMRTLAHLSQDPEMMAAAIAELDFHRFTASMAHGISMEEVTAPQRQLAKHTVSFGVVFGAGDATVAKKAGAPVAEIARFRELFDAAFPGVVAFQKNVSKVARQRERAEGVPYINTVGGRRVPQLDGRTYALVNYCVQGGSADIYKDAILRVDAAGYGDWVVLPVHDSLLLSVPAGAEDEVPKVAALMEDHDTYSVPFTVDISGPLSRWGEESK